MHGSELGWNHTTHASGPASDRPQSSVLMNTAQNTAVTGFTTFRRQTSSAAPGVFVTCPSGVACIGSAAAASGASSTGGMEPTITAPPVNSEAVAIGRSGAQHRSTPGVDPGDPIFSLLPALPVAAIPPAQSGDIASLSASSTVTTAPSEEATNPAHASTASASAMMPTAQSNCTYPHPKGPKGGERGGKHAFYHIDPGCAFAMTPTAGGDSALNSSTAASATDSTGIVSATTTESPPSIAHAIQADAQTSFVETVESAVTNNVMCGKDSAAILAMNDCSLQNAISSFCTPAGFNSTAFNPLQMVESTSGLPQRWLSTGSATYTVPLPATSGAPPSIWIQLELLAYCTPPMNPLNSSLWPTWGQVNPGEIDLRCSNILNNIVDLCECYGHLHPAMDTDGYTGGDTSSGKGGSWMMGCFGTYDSSW